jgi:hypothetical protein
MNPSGEAQKLLLVCGSKKLPIHKSVLSTKTQLFRSNPALLGFPEYRIRSRVSDRVFSDFIQLLSGLEIAVTADNCPGFSTLADEFGFVSLQDKCRQFRPFGQRNYESDDVCHREKVSLSEISKLRERTSNQDRQISALNEEVTSLRLQCLQLETAISDLSRTFESEQNYRRFCELCFGLHSFTKSEQFGFEFLRRSSDSGHSDAQYRCAVCFENGGFCAQNHQLASRYARMWGEGGNPFARDYCARFLENGLGVRKDRASPTHADIEVPRSFVAAANSPPLQDSRTVRVWNIGRRIEKQTLGEAFRKFGEVESIRIITRIDGWSQRRSLGYGFVDFKTQEGFDAAIRAVEVDGCKLQIAPARALSNKSRHGAHSRHSEVYHGR